MGKLWNDLTMDVFELIFMTLSIVRDQNQLFNTAHIKNTPQKKLDNEKQYCTYIIKMYLIMMFE